MAKIMDPLLPILSMLGYCVTVLGTFAGPGNLVLTLKRDQAQQ